MKTILYHGNCPDGFGAAFAAWLRFGNDATYIPVNYGKPVPPIEPGSEVFIVDFSYPAETLLKIGESALSVMVLDHHKTAQKDLSAEAFMFALMLDPETFKSTAPASIDADGFNRVRNIRIKFDMEKSGAMLALEFFHPDLARGEHSEFFRYLEDRDLWRFKLPMSREVSAAVRSYPMDFETWSGISGITPFGQIYELPGIQIETLKKEGKACLQLTRQMVDVMAKHARRVILDGKHKSIFFQPPAGPNEVNGFGVTVPPDQWACPVSNASVFFSEVGEKLLEIYPDAPFSAYYSDRSDGKRQWGLRSRPEFDCSVIAKAFGGGGHAQASGFIQDNPNL